MPDSERPARTGRPPQTSRAELLAAAQRVIDRDGWQQLTIRRLAAEAGTSPASVYNHLRDKDAVLVALLNDYADQLPRPRLPRAPRARIIAAAATMHDVLTARPWIVEVLTADDLLGESALWLVETILAGAIDAGATAEQAVRLYRSIWYYTVGEILVRASRARARDNTDRPVYREQTFARLDPAAYPQLTRLAPRWARLTSQDTYAHGLRVLVDGSLPTPPRHLRDLI